ncbi:MAG: YggS family pyridoxal phosphate-dependent enzyme [Candidatus Eisenbacteria bacterium]|uniref:Pyridoxal phosphate homeostasis protein n=1 Tax=Eiseniibacteriota bacterium TaxID=2212470 RepID=A0A7Y2EGS1_UNCEI|nr:YggS family pyridoxal phosphate-dependent enzyme [Candidatus Eisenbacteria bacterium]
MFSPEDASREAQSRLQQVLHRIHSAAEAAGRDPAGVKLLAVSKVFPAEAVVRMALLGQTRFGENRVQEAVRKIPEVHSQWDGTLLEWRLIGHLQRNKAKAALDVFTHIDSLDSVRLAEALDAELEKRETSLPVLLQFNCSGETSKGGFEPENWEEAAEAVATKSSLRVTGLMTIGANTGDPEDARDAFRKLVEIQDRLQQKWGRRLPDLSMGMSGDLEIAVEEGSTMVRVGTALFGAREKKV